jgi:hypothetical protein
MTDKLERALESADLPDDAACPVGSTDHERTLAAEVRRLRAERERLLEAMKRASQLIENVQVGWRFVSTVSYPPAALGKARAALGASDEW